MRPPCAKSCSATRSIVSAGMASAVRRGPGTAIPIKADRTVDMSTSQAPPGAARGRDHGKTRHRSIEPADDDGEFARPHFGCGWRLPWACRLLDPEHRNIGAGIATRQGRGNPLAFGREDENLLVACQRIACRHDQTRSPYKAA